jgi:hypothetical protein
MPKAPTPEQVAPAADRSIQDIVDRVRAATGCNENADRRDVAFLLARLDALELGLGGTRDFIAAQSADCFGYDEEGDPEIATRSWPVRDYEIWCIDQVLKHGVALGGRRHADRYEAQFDVMSPDQEELAIKFCNEIGEARDRGLSIDAVRLLEMAYALYQAEMDDTRRDVYHDEDKREALRTLDRIMDGLHGLPEGNWSYRPRKDDDWGMLRNLNGDGETIGFVANTRSGLFEAENQDALAAHRKAGTDPYAPIGRHLANCNPSAIRRVLALVRHLENEVRRLSKLDREYARVESWIIMNTEFDGNSKATDCGDRLIDHLQGLKRRADSAGRRKLS